MRTHSNKQKTTKQSQMEIKQKHQVKNSDFNEETNEMSAPTSAKKKTRELNSKVLYIQIELSTLQNWKN